jgi:hypothetical protein
MPSPLLPHPGLRSPAIPALVFASCAGSAFAADAFETMSELQYELLFSVPAIIYGLALANLVSELGWMLRAPRSVPRSIPQIIWIFVAMLFILIMFFAGTKYAAPLNHFGVFLSTIVLALLLYLASDALVIPNERRLDPNLNYRTEFYARSRHFITYTLLALFWLTARDTVLFLEDSTLRTRITTENFLRLGVSVIFLVPLVFSRAWTHIPAGLCAFAALIYHIHHTPGFILPMPMGSDS